jgi:hypothetical protein
LPSSRPSSLWRKTAAPGKSFDHKDHHLGLGRRLCWALYEVAVPTSAWHRELRRDDITFTKDQQKGMDMVDRVRMREGDINTYMEVKTLTQLHRLELINSWGITLFCIYIYSVLI